MVYQKTTPYGLRYPESSDNTRTWEHWQALAQDANDILGCQAYSATVTGVTISSGALGFTQGLTIPVVTAYPRLLLVAYSASFQANGNGLVEVGIRRNGTTVSGAWVNNNLGTGAGAFIDVAAAGATVQYQGIITVRAGSGNWSVGTDPNYAWLQVLALAGVKP